MHWQKRLRGSFTASPIAGDGKVYFTNDDGETTVLQADTPSFVEVGSVVRTGQTLCIIEAMKLMNEIEAEHSGTIVEIFAQNGKAVEFGQKLFRIKKA